MAADEILGISGQLDISDIQQSFDKLINDLNLLGVKTDEISSKMTKALNEIAQSSASDSEKTKQSVQTLKQGIEEINKSLADTPEALKKLASEAQTAEATIDKLKKRLSETTEGSQKWNEINEQLKSQQSLVEKLNDEYLSMLGTFGSTQQYVGTLNAAIDTLNAGRSISTAATGANAAVHAGAAAAVGTESVAHGVNAEKIGTETQAVKDSTQAYQAAAEASQQRAETANAEAAALDKLTERVLQGKISENEYIKAKESAEERYRQLMDEQTNLLEKEKKAREEAYTFKAVDGNIIDNNNALNAQAADALLERANKLKNEADEIASSLQRLSEAYTSTAQKAEAEQKQETESTNKTLDAIRAKEDELKKLNEQLEQMEAHHANGWGGDFITSMRKGENPFATIKEYFAEGDAIKEKQQQIADVTAELGKLRTASEEVKAATADIWSGMSKEDIHTIIQENINQLKILKSKYSEIVLAYGKNSDKAEENKRKQKEITREIIQGKEKLREMGTSYEDVAKTAKKTAENTKKIGENAQKSGKNITGLFGKAQGVFSNLSNGNFSGLLGMVGKAGIYGAVAVAIGKSVQWLSQQAESLRVAMAPLKTYLDEGTLEELRRQFVEIEYSSSHSAEEMAAAGTRWVKYFEGLRDNAHAIAEVTKNSNDLATVLGTTSDKAAEYQLKIAGAYHQSALEATHNNAIIINASKQSTATYEEMAQTLASTANRAQNAGISLKELAAAAAYGKRTFGSANEAASSYVMMMTRLSTQAKNEYNPAVVGATRALTNLSKSQELNDTLTSLLGKRQASLAKVFVQNAAAITKMRDGLDNEASAAATVAAAEGKMVNVEKRLQNAKKALAHEVNANLTPAYASFVEYCTYFAKTIGQVTNAIKKGIKPVVDYIASSIASLDKKLGNSRFSTLLGKGLKGLSYIANPLHALTIENMVNDKRQKSRQEHLKQVYNEELEKAGEQSPGKAYLKAAKRIANNGKISKEDKKYLQSLMSDTRTLANSKPTDQGLAIGEQNAIKDKSGQNKLKQLQEQQRKFREEEAEREAKELAASEKTKWDLYVAEKEAGILRLESASEKEVAQHKLDYEKQKHAIEEEQKNLLNANIAAAKQAYDKNPENKNKEGFYASGLHKKVTLTSDQKALINAKYEALEAQENAYDLAQLKKKTQSLYDYLKEYGTFKEQQLAIAKEYDAKIKEAEAQGDTYKVKTLQAEKAKQVGTVRANEIESKIDYAKVFGEFGVILEDQMTDILKTMKDFSKTDTFKAKPLTEQKDFLSRMNELSNQYGTSKWEDINFSQLGKLIDDYNQKLEKRNKAEEKLNESSKKLAEAQEAYEKAMKSGNEIQILDATGNLNIAQKKNDDNRQALANADADLVGAQSNVTDSAQKLSSTLTSLDTLLQNMKSGSISSVWDSFVDFDKKVNGGKATKAVTDEIGKLLGKAFEGKTDLVSQIIGAVLNLLDVIAEQGIGGIVGGLINSVLSAVSGLLDNILSGDSLKQIGGSLVNGIGSILDTVTGNIGSILSFGALSSKGISSWLTNSNAEKVEKAINNLSDRNKTLQQSIEDLNDTMKNSSGAKSVETYKEAYKLQEEQNENYKKIAQEQAGYHGAHHSWNYYWNGFTDEETERIKKITGKDDFSGNLWDLTPEEMKMLRGGAIDIWEKIKDTGKGNYGGRLAEKLDDYIDQAGKLQDLTDQINESLTQISFSSMRDDFISKLMDMQSTAEDFSENFAEMMQKAVLRYGLENLINTDLKGLYEKWGKKMQEGQLSEDDINKFKEEYDKIVQKGIEERDYWAQITGYASQSQQTATGKAIEAITADQASSLVGIGYAIQSAVEQGNATRTQISVDISVMRNYAETVATNMSEMRDIQFEGLGQLQQIVKNTAPIILIREDIASMYKIMKDRY
nr:MAG TPA: Tape measure domain protein [Caudoviricetes sp.]